MSGRSSHATHPSGLPSVASASLRFPAALADRPRLRVAAFATMLLTLVANLNPETGQTKSISGIRVRVA